MFSLKTALLALAAAAFVSAEYTIDPDSVSPTTRKSWCASELSTCPLICQDLPGGDTDTNTCDPDNLSFNCVCGGGMRPNVSEYSLTLPYFICQEWGNQCVKDCNGDNRCASSCREDHPCGAQDPKRENKTATASSTASATDNSGAIATGFGSGGGGSDSAAPRALELASGYSLLVLGGSLFAGFALMA